MMATPEPIESLRAALDYAARGWMVMPIRAGTKLPASVHGVHDATSIEDQIHRLWNDLPEGTGIGVAGGGAGRLVIIDVDGDYGRENFERLLMELGPLPVTRTARTPRDNAHYYFRWPGTGPVECKNSVGKLGRVDSKIASKIDIRSVGGYVVAPPTLGYTWTCDVEPVELPSNWTEKLIELSQPKRQPRSMSAPSSGPSPARYADAALRRAVDAVRNAPEGERNNILNREAYSLAGLVASGELDDCTVRADLHNAATSAGLPAREASKTIDSGFAAGAAKPRVVPALPEQPAPAPAEPQVTSAPAKDRSWERMLRFDHHNRLTKDAGNAALLLAHDELWAGCLEYDAFGDAITWVKAPPQAPGLIGPNVDDPFEEWQLTYIAQLLARKASVTFSKSTVWDAVIAAARVRTRHPLQEYLRSLTWDGHPRLDRWLSTYLGAEQNQYTSAVGRWWMISAIARAMDPGCQADHVLVLEGPQGAGKTTAVRTLAGGWYLGSIPDIRDKDAVQVIQGRWIGELGELDALRGAARTRVKDFVTQSVDIYRPSYGRAPVRRPRSLVLIGTTNEHVYLDDPTGGRRWWGVRVQRCDRERLAADRDQLWAEALSYYLDGAEWWPSGEMLDVLATAQEERFQADPWEELVANWARGFTDFTVGDVLGKALSLPSERWDRASQTRAGQILTRLGYESFRPWGGGRDRQRRYRLSNPVQAVQPQSNEEG